MAKVFPARLFLKSLAPSIFLPVGFVSAQLVMTDGALLLLCFLGAMTCATTTNRRFYIFWGQWFCIGRLIFPIYTPDRALHSLFINQYSKPYSAIRALSVPVPTTLEQVSMPPYQVGLAELLCICKTILRPMPFSVLKIRPSGKLQ